MCHSRNEVIAFGRACDWEKGIASQVISGKFNAHSIGLIWNPSLRFPRNLSEIPLHGGTSESDFSTKKSSNIEISYGKPKISPKGEVRKVRSPSFRLDTPIIASLTDAIFDNQGQEKVNKSGFATVETDSLGKFCIGWVCDQGHRPHMEDDIFISLDLEKLRSYSEVVSDFKEHEDFERKYPKHVYLAVFDGHNGFEAVKYVRQKLPLHLSQVGYFRIQFCLI